MASRLVLRRSATGPRSFSLRSEAVLRYVAYAASRRACFWAGVSFVTEWLRALTESYRCRTSRSISERDGRSAKAVREDAVTAQRKLRSSPRLYSSKRV